jgi:hypothetical protein
VWLRLFCFGVLLTVACAGRDSGSNLGLADSSATSLQAQCERSLDSASSLVVRQLAEPAIAWQFQLPETVGSLAGLDWDYKSEVLYGLDPLNAQIVSISRDGQVLSSFGRGGHGPADLDFGPISRMRTTRLILAGDSAIAVADLHDVKMFSRKGDLEWTVIVDTNGAGSPFDLGLAMSHAGEVVVSETGKMKFAATDMTTRKALDLIALQPQGSRVVQRRLLRLNNSFATLDSFVRMPPKQPYRDSYRRSWGLDADGVTFISWKHFGVCRATLDGHLTGSTLLAATPLVIDDAERSRVLKEELGGADARQPFLNVSGRQVYEGHWPSHGPLYQDLLVDEKGRAVAMRRLQGGKQEIDVYSRTGYLGSFAPPPDYTLATFGAGLLILVRQQDSHVLALRMP